ncbi:TPA: JAB domain-containing protein [Enterococcus faecium]|nr:DNA repair protein RadC [Enterococcus faecium]
MKSKIPSKRVDIVSLQLVKESSMLYKDRCCNSPQALYHLLSPFIEKKDREHLIVAGFNVKNEPTFINIAHIGTINQSLALPRDILKPAILSNSVAISIEHNHPSGNPTPSLTDIQFTTKLAKTCDLLDIRLLDHMIIGASGQYVSMRSEGHLDAEQ